jgi:hypothetical protein
VPPFKPYPTLYGAALCQLGRARRRAGVPGGASARVVARRVASYRTASTATPAGRTARRGCRRCVADATAGDATRLAHPKSALAAAPGRCRSGPDIFPLVTIGAIIIIAPLFLILLRWHELRDPVVGNAYAPGWAAALCRSATNKPRWARLIEFVFPLLIGLQQTHYWGPGTVRGGFDDIT